MINELQLELTNKCNSNCCFCPRERLVRPQGFMDYDFALAVINRAVELGVKMIKPQWFGESMLHPDYLKIIKYIKSKGLKVVITTNGSLLNKEMVDGLLALKPDRINISIDAGNKKDYEKIRRGLSWDVLMVNINYLSLLKKYSKIDCILQLDCLNYPGLDKVELQKTFENLFDNIILNELNGKPSGLGVCQHKVKNRLIVAWDGSCYLCCHDWLGYYEIGNLNNADMQEIWQGKKRLEYLNNLNKLEICQKCL